MQIQGREFRFEGLNITVAYFAHEADLNFDEKIPAWLGDDFPFDDSFSDFEDFTLREGGGVLIVAASNLTGNDMKLVDELVSVSNNDHIKLLLCDDQNYHKTPQFDAVITGHYDLVTNLYDLAFVFYTASYKGEGLRDITQMATVIQQSRNGILVCYWDKRKDKNMITPYDLMEAWPISIEKAPKVLGMFTWLNPASCQWSVKTSDRFLKFVEDEMSCKSKFVFPCSGYEPEFSRQPRPDVMQLFMIKA